MRPRNGPSICEIEFLGRFLEHDRATHHAELDFCFRPQTKLLADILGVVT